MPDTYKLTADEMAEIQNLLQPSIQFLDRGMIEVRERGQIETARKRIQEIAASRGCPSLPLGQEYGLASDGTLVAPQDRGKYA